MRGVGRSFLVGTLMGSLVSSAGTAATARATTVLGVRVERHTGILLPPAASETGGYSPAAYFPDRPPAGPTAVGNGSPRWTASRRTVRPPKGSAGRSVPVIELIVFEP
jgi:hypothetical protein